MYQNLRKNLSSNQKKYGHHYEKWYNLEDNFVPGAKISIFIFKHFKILDAV